MLPLTPRKGGSKSEFVVFVNKIQVQSNKVCYIVSLCENFQKHTFSRIIKVNFELWSRALTALFSVVETKRVNNGRTFCKNTGNRSFMRSDKQMLNSKPVTSTLSSWRPSELFSVLKASIIACFWMRVSVKEWSLFSNSSWLDAFSVFVVNYMPYQAWLEYSWCQCKSWIYMVHYCNTNEPYMFVSLQKKFSNTT